MLVFAERRYPEIEREASRCVCAVERLHNYLFGIEFTLLTDKPLSPMFDPYSSKVLPPPIRHLIWRLHQYSFRIKHIAGNTNTADSLWRLPSKQNDCSDAGFVFENYVRFVYMSNMSDQLSLVLTWDPKLAKMSRCPNYLPKFKTENGHAILILNRITA